jgi:hypothetical protein
MSDKRKTERDGRPGEEHGLGWLAPGGAFKKAGIWAIK